MHLDGLHCMPLTEVRCFWPRKQITLDQSGTRSPSRAVLAMVAPGIDELENAGKLSPPGPAIRVLFGNSLRVDTFTGQVSPRPSPTFILIAFLRNASSFLKSSGALLFPSSASRIHTKY